MGGAKRAAVASSPASQAFWYFGRFKMPSLTPGWIFHLSLPYTAVLCTSKSLLTNYCVSFHLTMPHYFAVRAFCTSLSSPLSSVLQLVCLWNVVALSCQPWTQVWVDGLAHSSTSFQHSKGENKTTMAWAGLIITRNRMLPVNIPIYPFWCVEFKILRAL